MATVAPMDMTTIMNTDIRMDDAALYRLMTWLSPGFPVGAYAYSHGLEWAVEDGAVRNRDTLGSWLEDILHRNKYP